MISTTFNEDNKLKSVDKLLISITGLPSSLVIRKLKKKVLLFRFYHYILILFQFYILVCVFANTEFCIRIIQVNYFLKIYNNIFIYY